MIYEKYELEILRYSMDLEQRVLDFNLLCSANVQEDKLRIGMREIDSNDPQNIQTSKICIKEILWTVCNLPK